MEVELCFTGYSLQFLRFLLLVLADGLKSVSKYLHMMHHYSQKLMTDTSNTDFNNYIV